MLGKNIANARITQAFQILHDEGIRAGVHFVLGFEEDSPSSIKMCLQMAHDIDALYCSINIYQPRLGVEAINSKSGTRKTLTSLGAEICMLRYNAKQYLDFQLTPKEMAR